jgi:predicted MFS family arabinose efflux permease
MVTGGLLTALHWRWVFFAPVVVAAVLLVVAVRVLPRQDATPGGRFDIAGSVTLTVAMLVLVLAIVRAPDVEPGLTAGMLVVAVVLLAGFTVIERRSAAPLVRLGILRSAALARANLGALLLVGSFMGFQFVAVLYLQELRNWSTIETGLALAVAGIDAVLAPTLTPVLVRRLGNARVVVAGLALAALAYALFLPLTADGSYWLMLPAFLVLGVAFALAYGPLTIAATDGVDEHEQGLAGGILTTSFQFGAALGLAVVTAVVVTASGGGPLSYDALRAGLLVALAAAVLGVVVTAPGLRTHARATT